MAQEVRGDAGMFVLEAINDKARSLRNQLVLGQGRRCHDESLQGPAESMSGDLGFQTLGRWEEHRPGRGLGFEIGFAGLPNLVRHLVSLMCMKGMVTSSAAHLYGFLISSS